jgi:hypothetical protein
MKKVDPSLYVTVGHAADIACVSRFWMRQQVQAGRVPGLCMDGIWFVLRSAAEAFERHPTAGRPRAQKASKFSRAKVSTQQRKP